MKRQIAFFLFVFCCSSALFWVACQQKDSEMLPAATADMQAELRERDCSAVDCEFLHQHLLTANDISFEQQADFNDCCVETPCEPEGCQNPGCELVYDPDFCELPPGCNACEPPTGGGCQNPPCPPRPPDLTCRAVTCVGLFLEADGSWWVMPFWSGCANSYTFSMCNPAGECISISGNSGPCFKLPAGFDAAGILEMNVVITCCNGETFDSKATVCPMSCDPCHFDIVIKDFVNRNEPSSWAIVIQKVNSRGQAVRGGTKMYGNCPACIPKQVGDVITEYLPCQVGAMYNIYFISNDPSAGVIVEEFWIDGFSEIWNKQNGTTTIDRGGIDTYFDYSVDKHQLRTIDRCH